MKQVSLMRRSTVLSLPPRLVFPGRFLRIPKRTLLSLPKLSHFYIINAQTNLSVKGQTKAIEVIR
jgi:hypothetical protein